MDNCLVKFARCCNPVPGDPIIGFITRGYGVSIHKRDCINVPRNVTEAAEPDRWVHVHWEESVRQEFKATLHLTCLLYTSGATKSGFIGSELFVL